MPGSGGGLTAGKVGYTVSCLVAAVLIVVSGYAYKVTALVGGIEGGAALPGESGTSTGAMNILLMGLESRTNYWGQTLSSQLLTAMHAGSVYGVNHESVGGQDTNTLILVHIFAGGEQAVGYSIPRDDWVTYPEAYDGQSQGKIDQAYGLAYAQSLSATVSSTMTSKQRYELANQKGQLAEVATVESVTGQHVWNFAEVNLAGFFSLAQAFNGIEVCVKSYNGGTNLTDANSGFNAVLDGYNLKKGGSQYLHLAADQALAFVRERDNLHNGDLDRTHRQQAVLDYVMWKLKTGGILTDLGQLTALLGTARQYIMIDPGWNLLDFSTQMHALSGQHLKFYTAPIAGFETVGGQDANQIDIPRIKAAIKAKFTASVASAAKSAAKAKSKSKSKKKPATIPAASTVAVDVYNGGTTTGLAASISNALVAKGYKAGLVTNASAQSKTPAAGTEVFYGAGTSANAAKIASYLGATATASALKSVAPGHVEVLLGTRFTAVPAGLAQASASAAASSGPAPSAGNNGASGGAVTVNPKAKYGIPCEY